MTAYTPRRGLLVPVDAADDLAAAEPRPVDAAPEVASVQVGRRPARWRRRPVVADDLADRLAAEREVAAVRRADDLARRAADVDHDIARREIDDRRSAARSVRRERRREARSAAELAALWRRAARDGARARIRADIQRSAEMRALRVAAVQRAAIAVGLPVLAGFAAWSTPGVHAGLQRLLHLTAWSPGWWVAWLVEPLLITVAAGVILARAMLRSAGGDTDRRADVAEWTALLTSVALNMLGGWSTSVDGWSDVPGAVGEALGHAVGAVGAAGTAWLIGVLVDYTAAARPWDGAPRLADLDLPVDRPGGDPAAGLTVLSGGRPDTLPDTLPDARPDAINRPKHPSGDRPADGLSAADRALLADVQEAIRTGRLGPDPSAHAIRMVVMGGRGDKSRAMRIRDAVAGWRPTEVA